jgi:hypothetical protein
MTEYYNTDDYSEAELAVEDLRRKLFPCVPVAHYETDETGLIDSRSFTFGALESTKVSIYKDRFVFEQTVFQETVEWVSPNHISSTNIMERPLGKRQMMVYYNLNDEPIPMEVDTCTSWGGSHPDFATNFILALHDENGHLYNLNLEASDYQDEASVWVVYKTNGDRSMQTIGLTEKIGIDREGNSRFRDIYHDRRDLDNFGLRFLTKEPVYYILSYLFSSYNIFLNDVFSSFFKGDCDALYKLIVEKIYPYAAFFRMKQIKEELIAAVMHPRRIEKLLIEGGWEVLECF